MSGPQTVRLTPAARRWIYEHGGAFTLRHSLRHGCCGGTALVPIAQIGEPQDPEQYVQETIDDIRIYRSPSLNIKQAASIVVELAGLWRWRRLVVTGLEITTSDQKAKEAC